SLLPTTIISAISALSPTIRYTIRIPALRNFIFLQPINFNPCLLVNSSPSTSARSSILASATLTSFLMEPSRFLYSILASSINTTSNFLTITIQIIPHLKYCLDRCYGTLRIQYHLEHLSRYIEGSFYRLFQDVEQSLVPKSILLKLEVPYTFLHILYNPAQPYPHNYFLK